MDHRLAVAVIGAGVHGSRYAEHLLRGDVPGARLAGVCRRSAADAEKWRFRGARFETEAAALVDDPSVDAFVVASPPALHEEHALAVLGRGKPLLLEKPVAPDVEACARIREAARRAGVPVLVGHSLRYNGVVAAFRDSVRSLGALRGLHLSQRHERLTQDWQLRGGGGGALLGIAVHLADMARWITGGELSVDACRLAADPAGADGEAVVLGGTASGAALVLDASVVAPARRGSLEALSDGASLEGEYLLHELWIRRGRSREAVPGVPPAAPGLVPLLKDFAAAARGSDGGRAATLDDGIAAVEFVEAARRAAGRHSPR